MELPRLHPSGARPPTATPRVGSAASTTLRRRVLNCAALAEWDSVRHAVEIEGCSVNIQDEQSGLSLVHWAAHQDAESELRWLLDKGAFPRLKDKRGHTALAGAKGSAVELLLQRAYSAPERVVYSHGLPSVGRLEAELIGEGGVSCLNDPLWDEGGATLAIVLSGRHGADSLDALPLLRWLHAKGADIEAIDEDGNGILHMVDWSLSPEVTMPLLQWALQEAGVRHVDVRNRDGDTPPLLCAYSSPTGEAALCCLQVFEAAGANLSLGSAKGVNVAMTLARYHGDGPWIAWCFNQAGVEPKSVCARGRSVVDYVALHGTEETDDEDAVNVS